MDSFIIDKNTKIQLITIQITPKENIDEHILKNPINENIDETKWLTSGIDVMLS